MNSNPSIISFVSLTNLGDNKDPAQLAYLVAQIDFVTTTERALKERLDGGEGSMKRALDDCLIQLADLVNAAQSPMSKGE